MWARASARANRRNAVDSSSGQSAKDTAYAVWGLLAERGGRLLEPVMMMRDQLARASGGVFDGHAVTSVGDPRREALDQLQ